MFLASLCFHNFVTVKEIFEKYTDDELDDLYAWYRIVQPDHDNHRTARLCFRFNESLMNAVGINKSTEGVKASNYHDEEMYLPMLNRRLDRKVKHQSWNEMRGGLGF